MSHIFISYSKKDIDFARYLRQLLQDQGFAVWMDETRIVPGEKWWPTIEQNIITCAAFVVIMSPNAKESDWVERELLVAEDPEHRKPIFPILLSGKGWTRLGDIHYENMTQGITSILDADFVDGLRKYMPSGGGQVPPPLPEPILDTASVPIVTPPNRTRLAFVAVVILLFAGVAGTVILNQIYKPTSTPSISIDDMTATALEKLLAGTSERQTQVALASTLTPTFTPTIAASSTRTLTTRPSDTPFDANDATTMTYAKEATETANAIASYSKTPIPASTLTSTFTSTSSTTPTVTSTSTLMPTPTSTFTPTSSPTLMPTATRATSVTPTPLPRVTNNGEWQSSIHVETFSGIDMVLVPAGCFQMGSQDGDADEGPIHVVCFNKPFWIDQFEVTNEQYGSAGDFQGAKRPRENVSWAQADTFCRQHDARLPTEAEWEYSARGPDNLMYPWGDIFDPDKVVFYWTLNYQTADIGSMPTGISWVGAYNLSGNVWEWVADRYSPYSAENQTNPSGSQDGDSRVLRGGAFTDDGFHVRAANRDAKAPNFVSNFLGFRCARDYE